MTYNTKIVTKWECPDGAGVPLITMPNVPKPLHGLPPRKIMGQAMWDRTRKRCYFDANYKCEICGAEPAKGRLAAHELYSYDYTNGTGTFNRCIAVCPLCHNAIHSGRLLTMYKNRNVLYPKSYVLKVVEHCFKLVSEYNATHGNKKPLRVYNTFLNYLKVPTISSSVRELIDKYGILFYAVNEKKMADWEKWRLVWNKKEYPTPYKTFEDWKKAMEGAAKQDTARAAKNPFVGDVFDEIDEIVKNA